MKSKRRFVSLMVLSVILIALSLSVLRDTQFIAPIVIGISAYLFFGAMIKLCKTDDRFKNKLLCMLDLLFWLP